MRLLRTTGEELRLDTFNDERKLPKYGILSHVWLPPEEEVTFDDLRKEQALEEKTGWAKLDYARRQAHDDGFQYVWIDTCCIDKNSSAELAEAINSMYRWYMLADVCYVYLADMPDPMVHEAQSEQLTKEWDWDAFAKSRWFTRGWTLQEMMAPRVLQFFNSSWIEVGTLAGLARRISTIAGVHIKALRREIPISSFSIAQRMSWAADRETTKVEDQAYSLLGIFDISLPIIYGEGEKAFMRLQEEILRIYPDQTIFSWLALPCTRLGPFTEHGQGSLSYHSEVLAKSPRAFKRCGLIVPIENEDRSSGRGYEMIDQGVRFTLPGIEKINPDGLEVALKCCFENDCTKLLVLVLTKVEGSADSYVVHRLGGSVQDIGTWLYPYATGDWRKDFGIQDYSVLTTFTVLHTRQHATIKRQPQTGRNTMLCALTHRVLRSLDAEIALAEPPSLWNSSTNSFFLPTESSIEGKDQKFHGQIVLRYGRNRWRLLTLHIAATRNAETSNWDCHLTIEQSSSTRLFVLPYTYISPVAIDLFGLRLIVTTIKQRTIVHQTLLVVQVAAAPFFDSIFLGNFVWICVDTFTFLFWTTLSFSMLPMAVALPVLTLSIVRQHAYATSGEDANLVVTLWEGLALGIGLSVTCAISAWVLLDSKIYIKWRPLSWRMPVLLVLRFGSWVIALELIRFHAPDLLPTEAHYTLNRIWTVALVRFLVSFAATGLPALWPVSSSRKYLCIAPALINAATVLPVLILIYPFRFLVVPWTTAACEESEIPDIALDQMYNDSASFEDVCNTLAQAATIVWLLIALGLWQLALECLAIYQTLFWKPRSAQEKALRQNRLQRLLEICTPWRRQYSRI